MLLECPPKPFPRVPRGPVCSPTRTSEKGVIGSFAPTSLPLCRGGPQPPHLLAAAAVAAASYCSGTRRLRSPGRISRNNCKPELIAGSV